MSKPFRLATPAPRLTVPVTCSRSYSVPGVHAADFDLESRPRVKGHIAGGSQQAGAVPWRHGSIGRGDTADWAGAAKRSTGNIHQTAGSVTVYQQGPGANRRGAGVGIRGVAESQYAERHFSPIRQRRSSVRPKSELSPAPTLAPTIPFLPQDSVVKVLPVEREVLLIVELSSGDQQWRPSAESKLIRRDHPGGESPGGVGMKLISGGAIEIKRGRAGRGAVECNACGVPLSPMPEAARVAQVTGKNHASVDHAKVGRTLNVTSKVGRTGAARTSALQTEWAIQRDVTTECLRTSACYSEDPKRGMQAIAKRTPALFRPAVINNNVTRDARVCTRAGDAELRRGTHQIDSFAEIPMVIAPDQGASACINVHEACTQFEGIIEGIGRKRGLSGAILGNRPGKSGQGSVQGKGACGI